jgi:8-oxo-dGTP diphosphatase
MVFTLMSKFRGHFMFDTGEITACAQKNKNISRFSVVPCVYLFFQKEQKILLSLRQNTGWCDHQWGLVSGHIEVGETPLQAAIREAQEEAGILLEANQLALATTLYRQSDRTNIDFFFSVKQGYGTLTNAEPEKCGALEFFDLMNLPKNTIDYVQKALHNSQKGIRFDTWGF